MLSQTYLDNIEYTIFLTYAMFSQLGRDNIV